MVVQTNELEFTGKTLQEYLEWKYPEKEDKEGVEEIDKHEINDIREKAGIERELVGGELDLREFINLTILNCSNNNLTSLNVSQNVNLTEFSCHNNKLTSVDFLKTLPNPEKLEKLEIFDNNIQSITLDFLRPFVNLKDCKLGENKGKGEGELKKRIDNKTYNKFYGSLEPIKNLTKLEEFCIAGTDVEEGIEYIPSKIAQLSSQAVKESKNVMRLNLIDCQTLRENAKVAKIQNELRPFNYDIEAWQLAHPEKMVKVLQEKDLEREQWLKTLTDKITNTQTELSTTKANEADKLSKIARLETTIQELTQAKTQISRQTQTEFSTQDKGTQTDLTFSQLTQLEQDSQTFLKLLHATEQELTNTKQQLTQIQEKLTNQSQQIVHQDQTITHLEQQKTQTNQTITNLQGQMEVKKGELQQAKEQSNKLSSELETAKEKNQSYLENIKRKEEIINDNNQQIKHLESQLQTSQTELTTQSTINQDLTNAIKQLQSKIKLLEQQKENYQTKYDKSIEFIKEIREDIIKM